MSLAKLGVTQIYRKTLFGRRNSYVCKSSQRTGYTGGLADIRRPFGRLDGRTVSNYHLLPEDILLSEGWLPCEEVKPDYNPEKQYLVIDKTEVKNNKVIATYKVVDFEE